MDKDINKFMEKHFKDLQEGLMVAELVKMILETAKKCGTDFELEENENFRKLLAVLCVFGISLSDTSVMKDLEDLFDRTADMYCDENDNESEAGFGDEFIEVMNQKWWFN